MTILRVHSDETVSNRKFIVRIVQHVHIVWGGGKDYTMADM